MVKMPYFARAGDKLSWRLKAEGGEIVIAVRPIRDKDLNSKVVG